MDDLLPSYASVIQQNPWEIIAPYISSSDLCSAALVCQKFNNVFMPQLWGNPASHFGIQNDTVYVALTRFKRTLVWARLRVRELTHTLRLPPAHAELYDGPHSDWLRDCLERLPRLQSLILDGLPFFDHASLITLRHPSLAWRSSHPNSSSVFGLRLLDAAGCSNATSTGLMEALPHFPYLVSLDLSRTLAAKNAEVFNKIKLLSKLRVLKLAGLGLIDADIALIASAIGTRVSSLDVSNNKLTDRSARILLDYCIERFGYSAQLPRTHSSSGDVPIREVAAFETANLDLYIRKKLVQGFVGSLAIENAPEGITHLYISRNAMTVEGVSGLLRSKRLQALDIGTLPVRLKRPKNLHSEDDADLTMPGVEKLTPILAECASQQLAYLRINYAILTEDAPIDIHNFPPVEMEGEPGLYKPSNTHELEVHEATRPELDSANTGVYELPGDQIQPVELPVIPSSAGVKRNGTVENLSGQPNTRPPPSIGVTEPQEVSQGPVYAPESVSAQQPLSETTLTDATGGLSPFLNTFQNERGRETLPSRGDEPSANQRRRTTSTHYIQNRKARLDLRQSHENCLHPGMLPKTQSLVLTDVPTHTTNQALVPRLLQFIKDCAEEVAMAKLRAKHTYVLAPGRRRAIAEREYAQTLFSLRRIVLEMAPPGIARKPHSKSSWRSLTKSSTEDRDSESFWEDSTHDFSFFSDEECGLPDMEPGRSLPLVQDGLMLAEVMSTPTNEHGYIETAPEPAVDVVSEIAKFRRERKEAYESAFLRGEIDPIVDGYWPGDITVVRKPVNQDGGALDYYGNRYESGWFYR